MSNWVAHLVWGALVSLIPLLFIGVKYLQNPELSEKIVPFEYFIHLVPLGAVLNLALQVLLAPYIRNSGMMEWTNWIIGIVAGLLMAFYSLQMWDQKISDKVWHLKNFRNLYVYLAFYGALMYGLVLPYLQRQVCFHGPKGC
jgi:hypothetical protein